MATNLLSKVQLGSTIYDLKDADSRTKLTTLLGSHAVEALGAAAWMGKDDAVTEGGTGVVTGGAIKTYVDAQVATINKFDVVVPAAVAAEIPAGATYKDGSTTVTGTLAASATTMYKLYLVKNSDAGAGAHIEYITIRSGAEGSYTYAWEQIGSTVVDLTAYLKTADAEAWKVAGVEFGSGHAISVADLEASTALNLKALAHAATASGTVEGQTVTGVKATGDLTGSLTGAMGYDSTAVASTGKFTPAGSITGSAIAGGSIEVTLKDAGTATAATVTASSYTPEGAVATALTQNDNGTFQPAGTVSAPEITVTPASGTVKQMKTEGTGYTITDGGVTQGADTTSAFATEGLTAHMATGAEITGDVTAETLIFGTAGTSNAVTASGTVSYTKQELSGALPTFEDATVVTGITSASATAPTFTGNKYNVTSEFTGTAAADMKVTGVTYVKQEVDTKTFTPTAATLGFSGTEGDLSVSGNYDKAKVGTLAVGITGAELAVGDIAVASKSVTVNAD